MIRLATLADRPSFMRLWAAHMAEQEKQGSKLLASTSNLYRHLEMFEAYVLGITAGMCHIQSCDGEDVGIVMAGECLGGSNWETKMGRMATLWGVYVEPSHRGQGIAVKLFQACLAEGLKMGFDSVETYVRLDNPHGQQVADAFGIKPYQTQHLIKLRDPAVMNNDKAREALGREIING